MRRSIILVLALAGCPGNGASRDTSTPSNAARPAGWAPTLAVRAAELRGWLAVVDPEVHALPAVPEIVEALPGMAVVVVPATGDPVNGDGDSTQNVSYGCDNGTLDITTVEPDAAVAPGPALILPAPLPDGWAPSGVALRAGEITRERAAWTAGPLAISLTRADGTHARLAIRAGDRVLHEEAKETYTMEGGGAPRIDLAAEFQPGIPQPAAVFLLAPDGPALVVFAIDGFEGLTYSTLLVGAERAEPVETMSAYLYRCAF